MDQKMMQMKQRFAQYALAALNMANDSVNAEFDRIINEVMQAWKTETEELKKQIEELKKEDK